MEINHHLLLSLSLTLLAYFCFALPETENYLNLNKYNKDMQIMNGKLEALTNTVQRLPKKSERKEFQIKSLLQSQSHLNDRKSEQEQTIRDKIDYQNNDFNRKTMIFRTDFGPSHDKKNLENEPLDTILLNNKTPDGLKSNLVSAHNLMTSRYQEMEDVSLKTIHIKGPIHKILKREFEN